MSAFILLLYSVLKQCSIPFLFFEKMSFVHLHFMTLITFSFISLPTFLFEHRFQIRVSLLPVHLSELEHYISKKRIMHFRISTPTQHRGRKEKKLNYFNVGVCFSETCISSERKLLLLLKLLVVHKQPCQKSRLRLEQDDFLLPSLILFPI